MLPGSYRESHGALIRKELFLIIERRYYIMGYKSDIEIAQETTMQPITEIAAKAGIDPKYLEQYGNYKAKIDYNL